jgi:hypothetical protein
LVRGSATPASRIPFSRRNSFQAGVDVVVAQPPVYFPLQPHEVLAYFRSLLAQLPGPMIIYNIPPTTRVSIPLDVVGHARNRAMGQPTKRLRLGTRLLRR